MFTTTAEVGRFSIRHGSPNVVTVSTFHLLRRGPCLAVVGRYGKPEVFVDVIVLASELSFPTEPGASKDKQLPFKCQEMWVTCVTQWDRKLMNSIPRFCIIAAEHNDR